MALPAPAQAGRGGSDNDNPPCCSHQNPDHGGLFE
jgi:hypothetical protein